MMTYVAFALAGVGTFLLRSTPMLAAGIAERLQVDEWIRFVAPAALAAIVTTALAFDDGRLMAPTLPEVFATVAAAVIVRRTRNVAASLAAGLPVYWVASLMLA